MTCSSLKNIFYSSLYAKYLKKQISIKINNDTIMYFKELAVETGIPYQTIINMYLTDCEMKQIKVEMLWK